MQLNGEQRKRFHESLLNAFPSKPLLKQMVDFELDENLDAIAVGENHSDTVFELINWARKEGKVKELLIKIREPKTSLMAMTQNKLESTVLYHVGMLHVES